MSESWTLNADFTLSGMRPERDQPRRKALRMRLVLMFCVLVFLFDIHTTTGEVIAGFSVFAHGVAESAGGVGISADSYKSRPLAQET